jgi:hypothetical protein
MNGGSSFAPPPPCALSQMIMKAHGNLCTMKKKAKMQKKNVKEGKCADFFSGWQKQMMPSFTKANMRIGDHQLCQCQMSFVPMSLFYGTKYSKFNYDGKPNPPEFPMLFCP